MVRDGRDAERTKVGEDYDYDYDYEQELGLRSGRPCHDGNGWGIGRCRVNYASERKSARGLAHSKTLARKD